MYGRFSFSSVYCSSCDRHFHSKTLKKRHDILRHLGQSQTMENISSEEYISRYGHLKMVRDRVCTRCHRLFGSKHLCDKHKNSCEAVVSMLVETSSTGTRKHEIMHVPATTGPVHISESNETASEPTKTPNGQTGSGPVDGPVVTSNQKELKCTGCVTYWFYQ